MGQPGTPNAGTTKSGLYPFEVSLIQLNHEMLLANLYLVSFQKGLERKYVSDRLKVMSLRERAYQDHASSRVVFLKLQKVGKERSLTGTLHIFLANISAD